MIRIGLKIIFVKVSDFFLTPFFLAAKMRIKKLNGRKYAANRPHNLGLRVVGMESNAKIKSVIETVIIKTKNIKNIVEK